MSWFRLDDDGAFHAKVVAAGNTAYGAWCRAGQWCSKHDKSGFLPSHVARLIAPMAVWNRALSAGLLDPTDRDGYQIHDFNDYNPTDAEAESRRAQISEKRAKAGALGGIKSGQTRSKQNEANAKQTGKANEASASEANPGLLAKQTKQNEAPSRPDPDPVPIPSKKKPRVANATPLADDWVPPEQVVDSLREELRVDVLAAVPSMRDWAKDKGITSKDWIARFRNWVREDARRGRLPPWEPPLLRTSPIVAAPPRTKTPEEIAAERAAGDALFDELAKVKTVSA